MHKLGSLVEIRSGYTFREPITELARGDTKVVQAKNLNDLSLVTLPSITLANDKHLLQNDDILLSARGSFKALALTNVLERVVASSSLFILRPVNKAVSAEFIACYLNSKKGQALLNAISSGAAVKTILKAELLDLPIPDIPPKTQNIILELTQNLTKQKTLIDLKQDLLQQAIDTAITQVTKEPIK